MKSFECRNCGSHDLTELDGFLICDFCQSKFVPASGDTPVKGAVIGVQSDIEMLLGKCETDPANRIRYARLILDLDPTNRQAMSYLS